MTLKEKIYNHCLLEVNNKISLLQQVLADLKESGTNETKSTAGDKHETALAMLQIEQANIREQLKNMLDKKATLEKINPALLTLKIVPGSLIKTNRGYLFMSIAAGKTMIEGLSIIALSPQSPLGSKLLGLSAGDVVEISNTRYTIESVE